MSEELRSLSVEKAAEIEVASRNTLPAQATLPDTANVMLGALAGVVAALAGAIVWAVVTAVTKYQIGWMAVGVGFLVGYAVRVAGKGTQPYFGYIGAGLALAGCVAGNLFSVVIMLSSQEGIALTQIVSSLSLDLIVALMADTFQPMDLLFYGLALVEGYKFSFIQSVKEAL